MCLCVFHLLEAVGHLGLASLHSLSGLWQLQTSSKHQHPTAMGLGMGMGMVLTCSDKDCCEALVDVCRSSAC
jgi:hypothetical protein